MEKYDIDELIASCEERRKEGEVIAFAVGGGSVAPIPGKRKAIKQALDYIQGLEGYLGLYPVDFWHTLFIFDTLNNAKGAKNLMKFKGIPTGKYVGPVLIPEEFAKEKK